MNPKEWALYKEMERDHVLSLVDDRRCEVRLMQHPWLVNYYNWLTELSIQMMAKTIIVHNEKVERLKELVETNEGKPMLVFYNFKHDLQAIKEAFQKRLN